MTGVDGEEVGVERVFEIEGEEGGGGGGGDEGEVEDGREERGWGERRGWVDGEGVMWGGRVEGEEGAVGSRADEVEAGQSDVWGGMREERSSPVHRRANERTSCTDLVSSQHHRLPLLLWLIITPQVLILLLFLVFVVAGPVPLLEVVVRGDSTAAVSGWRRRRKEVRRASSNLEQVLRSGMRRRRHSGERERGVEMRSTTGDEQVEVWSDGRDEMIAQGKREENEEGAVQRWRVSEEEGAEIPILTEMLHFQSRSSVASSPHQYDERWTRQTRLELFNSTRMIHRAFLALLSLHSVTDSWARVTNDISQRMMRRRWTEG
jgi:hypothetical protein